MCVNVDVFRWGAWLIFHKLPGDRGENWTGITASQQHVPATHGDTLPVLKELEQEKTCEECT